MVTIQISTAEILDDMIQKSRLDTATLDTAEQRYKFQVGAEKADEVYKCIQQSASSISRLLQRWLYTGSESLGQNIFGLPETLEFRFNFSERREQGKASLLADKIHEYIVELSLARFYATVGASDLSGARAGYAKGCEGEIMESICFKTPPAL